MKPSAIEVLQILMWLEKQKTSLKFQVGIKEKEMTIDRINTWLWEELHKYAEERAG